jgi:hypothetical protein
MNKVKRESAEDLAGHLVGFFQNCMDMGLNEQKTVVAFTDILVEFQTRAEERRCARQR